MTTTVRQSAPAPALPQPRGPMSEWVNGYLRGAGAPCGSAPTALCEQARPYGDDLQVALHTCYELHYRGFSGVDPELEWDPLLLTFRRACEQRMVHALRADIRQSNGAQPGESAAQAVDRLCIEDPDATGVSHYLREDGSWDQFREYFVLRSIYQLKEADPHAWVIPRLRGISKGAVAAVEFDEFGGGRFEGVHQDLFADLLAAADLRSSYLGYFDAAPAVAVLASNVASYLGLHARHRGAIVGHLAATEITSPPGAARLLAGLERLDAPEACRHFYREHVEADAVHEQIMRTDVVAELVAAEPETDADIVFGVRCFELVEDMLANHVMDAWSAGRPAVEVG